MRLERGTPATRSETARAITTYTARRANIEIERIKHGN
jgi:hypothetical protein